MKIPTHNAANNLGIHPTNLILIASKLNSSFEECWPEIDDGIIETIKMMYYKYKQKIIDNEKEMVIIVGKLGDNDTIITNDAIKVLDKLCRHKHWGNTEISYDGILNITHIQGDKLKIAIKELISLEYISQKSQNGPFSLNTAKKSEIERIIKTKGNR